MNEGGLFMRIRGIALFAVLLTAAHAFGGDGRIHHVTEKVPNSYIVFLERGVNANAIAPELANAHGGRVEAVMEHLGMLSMTLGSETAAENIARDPRVASVQEDAILHPASCRQLAADGSQWSLAHLNNTNQTTHFGAYLGSGLSSVRVYVIDSAVNSATTSSDFVTNGTSKVKV